MMKLFVHLLLILTVLTASLAKAQGLDELSAQLTELQQLRQQLQDRGIDTRYEQVTLHTIKLFTTYIAYDKANPQVLEKVYQKYHKQIPDTPAAMARQLPERELADCWKLLEQCRQSLEQLSLQTYTRPQSPILDGRKITINKGFFVQDDRPVFPGTLIWMPYTPENQQAFGSFKGAFTTLDYLSPDLKGIRGGDGSVLATKRYPADDTQFPSGLFLGHIPADWMVTQHPEIKLGARLFTKYDIDNPLIRDWLKVLIQKAVSQSIDHNPMHLYLLANEPHWASAKGGWLSSEASTHTHAKFRDWLKQQYADLKSLNTTWQASFESFDDVTIDIPIEPKLRGTAIWYDWCRFNMDRVTDWFTFLKTTIAEHDPAIQCTIKMLGGHMEDAGRDHGLDIEQLVNLQEVGGLDAHPSPANARFHDPNKQAKRAHPYAIDWRSQSNMLDMIKSISPDQPVYDSEWHGMGTVGWISNDMSHDFIRAAMWLSFLHGNSVINSWYWARKDDGKPMPAMLASPMAQPIALNAYGQTLHELNAYAPQVVKLAQRPKNVRIFYTEESAIQDAAYCTDLIPLHEAMTLTGASVGYLTPKMIRENKTQCDMLVVPNARFISNDSLDALAKVKTKLLFVGNDHFKFDQHGQPRQGALPITIDPASQIGMSKTDVLTWTLKKHFAKAGVLPAIMPIDRATGGLPMGVLIRVAQMDSGQYLVSLVNTATTDQDIVLKYNGKKVHAQNLMSQTSKPFDGALPSLSVMLLQVNVDQKD
ncbi:MAG: beta-galactosidase [Phycisphaeraceae bacterium JB051]